MEGSIRLMINIRKWSFRKFCNVKIRIIEDQCNKSKIQNFKVRSGVQKIMKPLVDHVIKEIAEIRGSKD